MKLGDVKISVRLAAAFGALTAVLVVVSAVAWVQLDTMRHDTVDITDNWLPSVQRVGRLEAEIASFRVQEMSHVLNTDRTAMNAIEKEMEQALKELNAERAAYAKHITGGEERALYDQFTADWDRYYRMHGELIVLSRKNATAQARVLLQGESRQLFQRMTGTLDKLVALNAVPPGVVVRIIAVKASAGRLTSSTSRPRTPTTADSRAASMLRASRRAPSQPTKIRHRLIKILDKMAEIIGSLHGRKNSRGEQAR